MVEIEKPKTKKSTQLMSCSSLLCPPDADWTPHDADWTPPDADWTEVTTTTNDEKGSKTNLTN